jgi:ABC-type polysaccharide/polyol phosphate transport system ATPase subunit
VAIKEQNFRRLQHAFAAAFQSASLRVTLDFVHTAAQYVLNETIEWGDNSFSQKAFETIREK